MSDLTKVFFFVNFPSCSDQEEGTRATSIVVDGTAVAEADVDDLREPKTPLSKRNGEIYQPDNVQIVVHKSNDANQTVSLILYSNLKKSLLQIDQQKLSFYFLGNERENFEQKGHTSSRPETISGLFFCV